MRCRISPLQTWSASTALPVQHHQFHGPHFTLPLQKPPHTHEHVFLISKCSRKEHLPIKDIFFPQSQWESYRQVLGCSKKKEQSKSWKDSFLVMRAYSATWDVCNTDRRHFLTIIPAEDITNNNFMGGSSNKILILCFGILVYFGLSNHFLRKKCLTGK